MIPLTRYLSVLILVASFSASAAEREPFPSNYTPHPCAADNACSSFERSVLKSAAYSFLGFTLSDEWVAKHYDEMIPLFGPGCRKIATCLTVPGNGFTFCDDVVGPEFRALCDAKFTRDSEEWSQCRMFVQTWNVGVDQRLPDVWRKTTACVAGKAAPPGKPRSLDVWMKPEIVTRGYTGDIVFYAIDPETRVPVRAVVTIEGQNIFSRENPTGRPGTYYPFRWPLKFVRIQNDSGRTRLRPPTVTLTAENYPPVTFPMPVEMPVVELEMKPPALRHGRNTVTVIAKDRDTGEPVEMRVMAGDEIAGDTNQPIVIEWKKGTRRPEIWATSLFYMYDDVTVAPGGK